MDDTGVKHTQRLSYKQKEANGKKWYKDQIELYVKEHGTYLGYSNFEEDISETRRMLTVYNLMNNILDLEDFNYICKPFGEELGELPARMVNRDILSGKIKAILGMEMKTPFVWNAVAVNPEATTRREETEYKLIKQHLVQKIMLPIEKEVRMRKQQELQGRELTPEETQKLEQEIAEEIQAMTPEEIKKYMSRQYQDPSEVLAQQILNYLTQKEDLDRKFNDGYKHGLLSAKELYYVGIENGDPVLKVVNPIRFSHDKTVDAYFIEEGEWAVCEYRMKPSAIVAKFPGLKDSEIDSIYEDYQHRINMTNEERIFDFETETYIDTADTIPVFHAVWKSLRKVSILTYLDEEEVVQKMLVDESYVMRPEQGDIDLQSFYIPEVYEGYKIGNGIYQDMQVVAGQYKSLDNLYYCPLPYYGVIYDNTNSRPTSLGERLKLYQYWYNIVMYRIELLMASDKGKKLLMNINMIPDSLGIDTKKFQYFFESTPFAWYNPNEEGTGYNDVNSAAKVVDLSLASDIMKYKELAEYIKQQAGYSVGITPQMEGDISSREAVGNVQRIIAQSSNILEPYFNLHNTVKRNVMQGLINTAKVCYIQNRKRKLSYILDDLSVQILDMDLALLENSEIGIFTNNNVKTLEVKEAINQLAHAAMQNQKIEMSDVVKVLRQDSLIEAQETLQMAEDRRREFEQQMQEQEQQASMQELERKAQLEKEERIHEKEMVILKEEERRKTEMVKGSMLAASFNPAQDSNNNNINDFVEAARKEIEQDNKREELELEKAKMRQEKELEEKRLKLEEKKISSQKKSK